MTSKIQNRDQGIERNFAKGFESFSRASPPSYNPAMRNRSLLKLLSALLSIPATLVWAPICAHYLFLFGFVSGIAAVGGIPAGVPWTPAVLSLAGFALSCGGLVGLVALWALILKGSQIALADKWLRAILLCGLWIGFSTSLIALTLAGYIFWDSGFNPFIHSLFMTAIGPIIVFLRERHRIRFSESSPASA